HIASNNARRPGQTDVKLGAAARQILVIIDSKRNPQGYSISEVPHDYEKTAARLFDGQAARVENVPPPIDLSAIAVAGRRTSLHDDRIVSHNDLVANPGDRLVPTPAIRSRTQQSRNGQDYLEGEEDSALSFALYSKWLTGMPISTIGALIAAIFALLVVLKI